MLRWTTVVHPLCQGIVSLSDGPWVKGKMSLKGVSYFVVLQVRRLVGRRKRKVLNQMVGRDFAASIRRTFGRADSQMEES